MFLLRTRTAALRPQSLASWTARQCRAPPLYGPSHPLNRRLLFNFLRRSRKEKVVEEAPPALTDDDLFQRFSHSPFPTIKARGEAIRTLARCPVCTSMHQHEHAHTQAQPQNVAFDCPDCGFPTHCSEEHWRADEEHAKYCSRLREVNEDEHDLRRGRKMGEFEMPGPQAYEEAISFANWDVFWYTRGFPSVDTERSRRHLSKILTYPISVASTIHQNSGLTVGNQRLTPEGSRSLAALRSTLHVSPGTPDTEEAGANKAQMRIFILGARAESSLPPHLWEQLCLCFPSAHFHLYFIGPQVSLPRPASEMKKPTAKPATSTTTEETTPDTKNAEEPQQQAATNAVAEGENKEPEKPVYLPNVYDPPTPAPIVRHKRTRSSLEVYGVPSYTVPYTQQLTITGMQANYSEVHAQFADTLDPYTDLFFFFSPGFGFPSPNPESRNPETGEPLLQIASPTEWGPVVPALLASRCTIFVTGFSPADVERDVRSLETAPGVAGEFDWVITPGPNAFGSEKWEVADFDPRVMVKTNWGIWAMRGKTREVREKQGYSIFPDGTSPEAQQAQEQEQTQSEEPQPQTEKTETKETKEAS